MNGLQKRLMKNANLLCENQFEAGVGGTAGSLSTTAGWGTQNSGFQNPDKFVSSRTLGPNSNTRLEVNDSDTDLDDFNPDDVRSGLEFELGQQIHKDKYLAKQTVIKHLSENPRYYRDLDQLDINDDEDEEGDFLNEGEAREKAKEKGGKTIQTIRAMEKAGKSKEEIIQFIRDQEKMFGTAHEKIRKSHDAPTSRPKTPEDYDRPEDPVDEIAEPETPEARKIRKAERLLAVLKSKFGVEPSILSKDLDTGNVKALSAEPMAPDTGPNPRKNEATIMGTPEQNRAHMASPKARWMVKLKETSTCSTAPKVNLDEITSIMRNLKQQKTNRHL